MGKKMEKFKTATEKTVETGKKVGKIAGAVVAIGSAILKVMDKGKK